MTVTPQELQSISENIISSEETRQYVTGGSLGGAYAYRNDAGSTAFIVDTGDPLVENGARAEIAINQPLDISKTCEYGWSFTVSPNTDIASLNSWLIVGQFHDQPNVDIGETWDNYPANSPPISLFLVPDAGGMALQMVSQLPNEANEYYAKHPVLAGVEYQVRFVIDWSEQAGSTKLYIDNVLIASSQRKNLLNAYRNYLKVGIYRDSATQGLTEVSYGNVYYQQSVAQMAIIAPSTAVEGSLLLDIDGVGLDLVAPVQVVATDGSQVFTIEQSVVSRDATKITIDLNCGLFKKIGGDTTAFSGVPLTDSNWSLKWVVGSDEFPVTITPPANHQQREVANSEKFGGWLNVATFGEQDQQFGLITTATNTVKHTTTNGKATGYLDGIERLMTETIKNYFFTAADGKWRSADIAITNFSLGGEFTDEFTDEFT